MGSNGEVDVANIASILGTFRRRHPATEVEFMVDHSGALGERVQAGDVDVALIQVSDNWLEPTDVVLWSDDLVFVTSASDAFSTQPIPFLDFDCCTYKDYTHAAMESAGIEFKTVFRAATSADVRAAVQAGIGVAAMSANYVGGDVVPWNPPAKLGDLPRVHQILRIAPAEHSDAVRALTDTIRSSLGRPHSANYGRDS